MQVFRRITLPLVMPTIGMVTILTFIWIFNTFELVFVMQGSSGNPYYATDLGYVFTAQPLGTRLPVGARPGRYRLCYSGLDVSYDSFCILFRCSEIRESEIEY